MKKKIAVFANGWSQDNLEKFIKGALSILLPESTDIFLFLAHGSFGMGEETRANESLIYDLPEDYSMFDGAVMLGAGMNFTDVIEHVAKKLKEAKIPTISMGYRDPDFYFLGSDNEKGMRTLTEHLIREHGCRNIKFIAGAKNHEDSDARLNTVRKVLAEHNIKFTDEDYTYTNWENTAAADYALETYRNAVDKPDAFICANDIMAIYVALFLGDEHINVPGEVIVTGFDYINNGKLFFPSISSVDQHFDKLGIKCASLMRDIFSGKDVPRENYVGCEFIPGESCGCTFLRNADKLRREYTREIPRREYIDRYKESRISTVTNGIKDSDSYSNLSANIRKKMEEDTSGGSDTFYLMIDPRIKELGHRPVEEMPAAELAAEYDVLCAKIDGELIDVKKVSRKELIPEYSSEGFNRLYTFVPLYIQQFFCGYFIMPYVSNYISDLTYHDYEEKLRDALSRYRMNLQMSEYRTKISELTQSYE